jgi:hypothetical protein
MSQIPSASDRFGRKNSGPIKTPARRASSKEIELDTEEDRQDPAAWRDEIVRTIFGDVGAIRRDFSCAIERKILLHGRLYVTERFICFYSNLFGFEKKIKIPYSHVTCVTKENTAVFIPNAIAVITARKEYVFRSFWDRDDCFNLLRAYHEMYRTVLEPASSHVEEEETQQESPKEKFEAPVEAPSVPKQDLLKRIEGIAGPPVERPSTPDVADTPEHARTTAKAFSREVDSTKLAETLHTCVLPVSVDEFFAHFLADGCGFPLTKFHEGQGDLEVACTPWASSDGEHDRELRFRRLLNNPMGPKSARTTKIQRCRAFGRHGLVLHGVLSMEDIPYRDCFAIHDRWVVTPRDDGVSIEFEFEVKWSKSTIFKRKIESSSRSDLQAYYDAYAAAARAHLAAAPSSERSPPPPPPPPPRPAYLPWAVAAGFLWLYLAQRSANARLLLEVQGLREDINQVLRKDH